MSATMKMYTVLAVQTQHACCLLHTAAFQQMKCVSVSLACEWLQSDVMSKPKPLTTPV